MRIILASPRGFCAGVNMAISSLDLAIQRYGTPMYVYHEIVHNRWVVEEFRAKGAVFVDRLDLVPEGSYLLYSAHGISPAIRAEAAARRLKTIDATCPLVTRVHREAIAFAKQGYTIILVGHAGHDEVIGTTGEAPGAIIVLGEADEIDRLAVPDPSRVACLTQTTLSVDEAEKIVARLRQRFPQMVGPSKHDICYATQHRQEAVRKFSEDVNLVLVVGSQNSSNSRRLAEIGEGRGVPSHLIDSIADIDPAWLDGVETVLVTAGASAPEKRVVDCVGWLVERFGATVEEMEVCRDDVHFSLPRELRSRQHNDGDG
jgi:4-hydroxy-3-methylbut-2-en-1-yl diphosphate reductase